MNLQSERNYQTVYVEFFLDNIEIVFQGLEPPWEVQFLFTKKLIL